MDRKDHMYKSESMIVEKEIRYLLRILCGLVDDAECELEKQAAEHYPESSVVEDRSGVPCMPIYGEEKDEVVEDPKEPQKVGYQTPQKACKTCEELLNKSGMLREMVEIKKEELKIVRTELCLKRKSLQDYKDESNELKECIFDMKEILKKNEDEKEYTKA